MNDCLISIVVPVYKVEKYLGRCVESLLAQTYSNLELILVDDGSPDRCGQICDAYASRDCRIKVIHKENGGLSDARNAGLAIAAGECVAFVDSDDWVSSEYIESMYGALFETGADICECSVMKVSRELIPSEEETGKLSTYTTEEALRELICDGRFRQHVWNKLYRKECIEGILFEKGKTNEDEYWTYQVFGQARKVARLEKKLYYYFQHAESIMGSGYRLNRLDALEAKLTRQKYIEEHFPALEEAAKRNLLVSCVYAGQMSVLYLQGEERQQAIKYINSIRSNKCFAPGTIELHKKSDLWLKLAQINFWATVRIKNLVHKGF